MPEDLTWYEIQKPYSVNFNKADHEAFMQFMKTYYPETKNLTDFIKKVMDETNSLVKGNFPNDATAASKITELNNIIASKDSEIEELTKKYNKLGIEHNNYVDEMKASMKELTDGLQNTAQFKVLISEDEKPTIETSLQYLANFFNTEVNFSDACRMLWWHRLNASGADFPFKSLLEKSKNLVK